MQSPRHPPRTLMARRASRLVASLVTGSAFAFLTMLMTSSLPYNLPSRIGFEFLGFVITILLFPGMLISIVTSGNIHIFSLWVAALGNFAFYFGVAYLVLASLAKRRAKRRDLSRGEP